MKKLNLILIILSILFVVFGIVISIKEGDTELVIFRLNERTMADLSMAVGTFLLFVTVVLEAIRRKVGGESNASLFAVGALVFAISFAFFGIGFVKDFDTYHLVEKVESPDGEHTIYYYETILTKESSSKKYEGVQILEKEGLFTYRLRSCVPYFKEDEIEWKDDFARFGFYVLEYSD